METQQKAVRSANRRCRKHVENLEPFMGSNLWGAWYELRQVVCTDDLEFVQGRPLQYIVYSYGPHWPLYIWDGERWYGNQDRYSNSTSRHKSYSMPYQNIIWYGAETMKDIAVHGLVGAVAQKFAA